MIKDVVFDLGGVLVDLDIGRCMEAFRSLGMPKVAELLNPYYPAEMIGRLESGKISFHEACDEMRRLDARPDISDERITWAYGEFLRGVPVAKLRQIDRRMDCADFMTCGLLRLMKTYDLGAELLAAIRETMLGFRFWNRRSIVTNINKDMFIRGTISTHMNTSFYLANGLHRILQNIYQHLPDKVRIGIQHQFGRLYLQSERNVVRYQT